MPNLTIYFPTFFPDAGWAGTTYALVAPDDEGAARPGEWLIGRHPTADLTVAAQTVSARHAVFTYSKITGRWTITDLGSRNGTRINGELLPEGDPRPIQTGDKIHLGPNPIYVVEYADDTVGDDGPQTIASTTALDHQTGTAVAPPPPAPPPPAPPPRGSTYADTLYVGVAWLLAPTSRGGMVYRLIVLAICAAVVVLILGGAS